MYSYSREFHVFIEALDRAVNGFMADYVSANSPAKEINPDALRGKSLKVTQVSYLIDIDYNRMLLFLISI